MRGNHWRINAGFCFLAALLLAGAPARADVVTDANAKAADTRLLLAVARR